MDRYIGLDVHSQSTAVGIISSTGKRLLSKLVETNATALIEMVKSVPGTRRLIFEEGTQSEWLSEVLTPHVHELVVTVPKKATGRAKSDFEDAFARAEELRRNAIDTRVFKPSKKALPLRDALRLYTAFNKDVGRAKNRYKALLRSRGISGLGRDAYDPEPEELELLLKQVPPSVALSAEATLEEIYLLEDLRKRASQVLLDEAKQSPAFKRLMTVPGIAEIRAATLLAIVVTPERFRQSHQFWSYCGLGIRTAVSAEYGKGSDQRWRRFRDPMTRGLNRGHPMLKSLFKGAAELISRSEQQPLGRHYRRLVANGMKEHLARLTLARKLAAIALAVWKSKEDYDPTKHKSFE
jgi:transposase